MEIETQKILSVFTLINQDQISDIKYNNIIYRIQVSFHRHQPPTHRLLLTKNYILLMPMSNDVRSIHNKQQIYVAKIDFELKFQVQFSQQNNPKSNKIGLTFFRNSQQSVSLYSLNECSINQMRTYLGGFINQNGFHIQFKPIKKLGKGNFASVYQVIRVDDGKKFAVKAFSKANTYSAQNGKQSLINELSVMRELSHQSKNLLSLQAIYQSNNSIYVVLQLLEGKNLFQVIKQKQGIFSLGQVRAIMKGLLRGLQVMHQKKIMHRDLKPENIMFRNQNLTTPETYQPVIVDFGLAADSQKIPYLFFRCGTPGFVAPQIIKIQKNEYYSPACDMFSIGCIFHLILTSQPIFPGVKYEEVYKKNKFLQYSIKEQQINKCNPFAIDLLERMIQNDPKIRLTPAQALKNCFFFDSAFMNQNTKINKLQYYDQVTNYSNSPISAIQGQ